MVSYLLQAFLQACCGVCLLAGRAVPQLLQLLPQALQAGSLQQIAVGLDSLQRLNHFSRPRWVHRPIWFKRFMGASRATTPMPRCKRVFGVTQ